MAYTAFFDFGVYQTFRKLVVQSHPRRITSMVLRIHSFLSARNFTWGLGKLTWGLGKLLSKFMHTGFWGFCLFFEGLKSWEHRMASRLGIFKTIYFWEFRSQAIVCGLRAGSSFDWEFRPATNDSNRISCPQSLEKLHLIGKVVLGFRHTWLGEFPRGLFLAILLKWITCV